MKTKLTLFAVIFVLAALSSCQKEKPVQKELQLTDFSITPAGTVAQVNIMATYPGKLTATLYVSQSQDLSNPLTFTAEKTANTEEPYDFTITATGLQKSTDYWCLVEVGNTFLSKKTSVKKFTTQAIDIESFTISGVTFRMIPVIGGTFTMGGTSEQGSDAYDNEKPAHSVTLSDFYMGETEVTQALWEAVMEKNLTQIASENGLSTYGVGDNYPMYYISWDDCQTFINKLNELLSSQLGVRVFALPTEAEWEYAARGGQCSQRYKYSGSNTIDNVAWYNATSNQTQPVAQKLANELGLYDMSGNVYEWCHDWFNYYNSNPQNNPTGPDSGSLRIYRGGCWFTNQANAEFHAVVTSIQKSDTVTLVSASLFTNHPSFHSPFSTLH